MPKLEVFLSHRTTEARFADLIKARLEEDFLGIVSLFYSNDITSVPVGSQWDETLLEGLRRAVGNARILVALEPASNTMRAGFHIADLPSALTAADFIWLRSSEGMDWDPLEVIEKTGGRGHARSQVDNLLGDLLAEARPGDHVIFMSNRGFENAPRRFFEALR